MYKRGIIPLCKCYKIEPKPSLIAHLLRSVDGLSDSKIGEFLTTPGTEQILDSFFDFYNLRCNIVDAMRTCFCSEFRMPSDSNSVEFAISSMSRVYFKQNSGKFKNEEDCHSLIYSLILLNSDLNNPNVPQPMTCSQFISSVRQMISQSVPQVIVSGITILSVFVSMIIISVPLTCISVFMVIVMLFVSKHVTSRSGKYFYQQQINLGKVNGFIEEMMEGQKVVKVFTHEEEAKKDFDKVNEELFESAYEANKYANILMPLIGNLGYVSYVLVALIGGVLAINGYTNLSIGALASFLQLNRSFNNPIGQISQQVNMVLMALAGASRIFALLDEEVEKDEGHVTLVNAKENEDGTLSPVDYRTGVWAWEHRRPDGSIEYVRLVGDVRFHDVTFGYNENKTILYDMNLFAKPGEKLAFVGATGAGKTTITNLINRFYDIQKGSITYDGIDIKLIKKADLRRSLGIVLQDTHLFTGTIMDNIRYGKLDATDEECIAAAKLANAHEFIMHLEHGYQTVLSGDGSSLSQGQCQLLAIARAAVANPPVLILDEATSSIDTRTESIVQSGMDKLMEGRTVFVIAHRLSTIKNSDAIMVLDQGRIIERGDHDKLIGQKGTYYQLYTGGLELD